MLILTGIFESSVASLKSIGSLTNRQKQLFRHSDIRLEPVSIVVALKLDFANTTEEFVERQSIECFTIPPKIELDFAASSKY